MARGDVVERRVPVQVLKVLLVVVGLAVVHDAVDVYLISKKIALSFGPGPYMCYLLLLRKSRNYP